MTATAENDFSNLEVYIYDETSSDLYVHHDIMLSAYPLCIEWLSHYDDKKCNLAIVGTFMPDIEVWNLDLQESIEPVCVLGNKKDKGKVMTKFKKG